MGVAELLMLVQWDGGEAIRGLKDLDKKVSETHGNLGKLGGMAVLGGAIAAAGTFAAALTAGTDAAIDDQKAQASLNQAIKNAGWSQNKDLVDQNIDAMHKYGMNGADTMSAMAKLTEAHIPLNEQLQVLQAAQNVAAGTGKDFDTSLKAIMMSAQGLGGKVLTQYGIQLPPIIDSTKQLTSAQKTLATDQLKLSDAVEMYGPKSKEAASAQKTFATQQALVNKLTQEQKNGIGDLTGTLNGVGQAFGGQADAKAKTFAGTLENLKSTFTDSVLVPLGQKVMPLLQQLANWFNDHESQIGSAMTTAFNLLAGAASAVGDAIGFVVKHMDIVAPILVVVTAYMVGMKLAMLATAAIGFVGFLSDLAAGFAFVQESEGTATAVQWLWNAALDANPIGLVVLAIAALVGAIFLLVTHLKQVGEFFGTVWKGAQVVFGAFVDFIKDHWQILLGILTGGLGLIVVFFVSHFTQIRDFVGKIIGDVVGFFTALPGRIFGVLAALWSSYVVKPFNDVKNGVSGIVEGIVQFFEKLPGRIWDAIKSIPGMVNNMAKGIPLLGGVISAGESGIGAVGHAIGHLAGGGNAAAGSFSWVGEKGPELVRFGANAHVFPTDAIRNSLGGGGSFQSTTNNIVVNNPHSDVDVMSAMESDRRLNQLAQRGILPGPRPPMAMPA